MSAASDHKVVVFGGPSIGLTAFTLIEVLVVVAIIALLIAILTPALSAARSRARVVACAANMRTAATGLVYYTEANGGYYPEAAHWAQFAHRYIQRRSADKAYTGLEAFGNGYDVHVGYYRCPGDPIRHVEVGSQKINGAWQRFNYRLSYGLNTYLVQQLHDPEAARQGTSYHCTDERRKASEIARPGQIISFADAGNDNIGREWEMEWDFDGDEDPGPGDDAVLEVHHRSGNNFAHADSHVDFQQILGGRSWHRGVPPFPWRWVPLLYLDKPAIPY